jgi:uncharacterized membrane protein YtjA (UPF0391 family)
MAFGTVLHPVSCAVEFAMKRYGNFCQGGCVPYPNADDRDEIALMRAPQKKECAMLGWAVTFLVVALVAAVLGFGGIAGVAIEAAKLVFFVAILLFAIAAIVGMVRGRTPTLP